MNVEEYLQSLGYTLTGRGWTSPDGRVLSDAGLDAVKEAVAGGRMQVNVGGQSFTTLGPEGGGEMLASSGAINDPTYGWMLPTDTFNTLNAPSGFWDKLGAGPAPFLMALGGLAAPYAASLGAAGAAGGGTGAGSTFPVSSTASQFGPTAAEATGAFGSIPTTYGWESFMPGGSLAGGGSALTGAAEGGGMSWMDDLINVADDGEDFIDVEQMIKDGSLELDDVDNFRGALANLPDGSTALQQAIDGSAQSIYDANAAAGMPGYDPSLASTAAGALSATGVLQPLLKALGLDSGVIGGALGKLGPLDIAALVGLIAEGRNTDPTVSSQTGSSTLPDWYTTATQDLVGKAGALEPSTGWQPYLDKASSYTDAGATSLPDVDLDAYMNPYLESVLDPMRTRYQADKARSLNQLDSNAAMMNAFGRNRHSIERGRAGEAADRVWNETEANVRRGAFDTATSNAMNDLKRKADAGRTYGDYAKTYGDLDMTSQLLPITAYSTALKGVQLPKNETVTKTVTGPRPPLLSQIGGTLGALYGIS